MSEPNVVRGEVLGTAGRHFTIFQHYPLELVDLRSGTPVTILRTTPEDVVTYRQRIMERLRGPVGTEARREVANDILEALGVTEEGEATQ